jgi:hypothetical protein
MQVGLTPRAFNPPTNQSTLSHTLYNQKVVVSILKETFLFPVDSAVYTSSRLLPGYGRRRHLSIVIANNVGVGAQFRHGRSDDLVVH